MSGYKDWIDQADVKIDYYSAFMKAWIAFNAWYNLAAKYLLERISNVLNTSSDNPTDLKTI